MRERGFGRSCTACQAPLPKQVRRCAFPILVVTPLGRARPSAGLRSRQPPTRGVQRTCANASMERYRRGNLRTLGKLSSRRFFHGWYGECSKNRSRHPVRLTEEKRPLPTRQRGNLTRTNRIIDTTRSAGLTGRRIARRIHACRGLRPVSRNCLGSTPCTTAIGIAFAAVLKVNERSRAPSRTSTGNNIRRLSQEGTFPLVFASLRGGCPRRTRRGGIGPAAGSRRRLDHHLAAPAARCRLLRGVRCMVRCRKWSSEKPLQRSASRRTCGKLHGAVVVYCRRPSSDTWHGRTSSGLGSGLPPSAASVRLHGKGRNAVRYDERVGSGPPGGRKSLPLKVVVEGGNLRSFHDDCELPAGGMRTAHATVA